MFSIIMVADGWRPKWNPKNVWRFHLNGMFIGAEHRILVLIFILRMRDLRQENKNYFRPRTTNTPSSRNIKNIRCNFGLHGSIRWVCWAHSFIHLNDSEFICFASLLCGWYRYMNMNMNIDMCMCIEHIYNVPKYEWEWLNAQNSNKNIKRLKLKAPQI